MRLLLGSPGCALHKGFWPNGPVDVKSMLSSVYQALHPSEGVALTQRESYPLSNSSTHKGSFENLHKSIIYASGWP